MNKSGTVTFSLPLAFFVAIALRETAYPLWVIAFVLMHESAHVVSCRAFGCRLRRLYPSGAGLCLRYDTSGISYYKELVISLSGSVINIICGAVLVLVGLAEQGMLSIVLGLVNLLPIKGLDGDDALSAILFILSAEKAQRIERTLSVIFSLMVWLATVYCVLKTGVNICVLIFSVWLVINSIC